MRWPILQRQRDSKRERERERGSSTGNGTIRHRWQNVNEPNGFIDEITCNRGTGARVPRIGPASPCTVPRRTTPMRDQSRFSAPTSLLLPTDETREIPDELDGPIETTGQWSDRRWAATYRSTTRSVVHTSVCSAPFLSRRWRTTAGWSKTNGGKREGGG